MWSSRLRERAKPAPHESTTRAQRQVPPESDRAPPLQLARRPKVEHVQSRQQGSRLVRGNRTHLGGAPPDKSSSNKADGCIGHGAIRVRKSRGDAARLELDPFRTPCYFIVKPVARRPCQIRVRARVGAERYALFTQ